MDQKNEIIAADFDKLAEAADHTRWDHNNNYYKMMLASIPPELPRSAPAIDIGCGTGLLCRMLAGRFDKVIGVDISEGQLNIARSQGVPGCEFILGDIMDLRLDESTYACIVSVAAAHHMPYGALLEKCKKALMPGGVLMILDLYEPKTLSDYLLQGLAFLPNRILEFYHNRDNPRTKEEIALWLEHGKRDEYMSIKELRDEANNPLGGGFRLRRLLYFRYLLTYIKPKEQEVGISR